MSALRKLGFDVAGQRGSHVKLVRQARGARQVLTIPMHDELATGTMVAIYRQVLRFVAADDAQSIFYVE